MREAWKPINGFEERYEISSLGRVRAISRGLRSGASTQSRLIALQPGRAGHLYVDLYKDGLRKRRAVHQLVLEAFVGPRRPGSVSRHLDDNPSNNIPGNLAWGSQAENVADMIRISGHYNSGKSKCRRGHYLDVPNLVRSVLRSGRRDCLACARERASAHQSGRAFSGEKADAKYASIMSKEHRA